MQVVERQQDSIVKSLSELRDIERQRVADEIAAIQRAEAARIAAREAAERRAREEEAARAKAEREERLAAEQARLAAEQARLEAEREERRRIDAAAAAELARQQVALEQARVERELELRRQALARTRPTWMVAVVGLSLAAAGALLWAALSSRAIAEEASTRARVAVLDREQARADAREARERLDRLGRELESASQAIQSALHGLERLRTQDERDALEAKLRREQQRLREIEAQRRRAIEAEERRRRKEVFQLPPQCATNAFAPGCTGK
jgi:hypothetical protein